MVDWNNREQAIQALRDAYPNMKSFLIDIVYDIYEESLTNEDLREEIERIEKENPSSQKPTMSDYDGYNYNTDCVKILKAGEFEDWYCKKCGRHETLFRSEDEPDYCKGCIKILNEQKDKIEEI